MELHPAESRLMDTSNQYHLWALPPGHRFPWGYTGRSVSERSFRGSVQRPFPDDAKPPDLLDEDPEERYQKAKAVDEALGALEEANGD
jgi:hypothetical protein